MYLNYAEFFSTAIIVNYTAATFKTKCCFLVARFIIPKFASFGRQLWIV